MVASGHLSTFRRAFARAASKSRGPCGPSRQSFPFDGFSRVCSFNKFLRKWIARVAASLDTGFRHATEIGEKIFFLREFLSHGFVNVKRNGRHFIDGDLREDIFPVVKRVQFNDSEFLHEWECGSVSSLLSMREVPRFKKFLGDIAAISRYPPAFPTVLIDRNTRLSESS